MKKILFITTEIMVFFLFLNSCLAQDNNLNIGEYAPDEIIIKFKSDRLNFNNIYQVDNYASENNISKQEILQFANAAVFQLHGETVLEAIARLKNDPAVDYVQPNFKYRNYSINSNDPDKDALWGLDNYGQIINTVAGKADADIDAPEAWAINEGANQEVIVAVIDMGVGYNHPDLISQMWDGSNCKDENGNYLGGCLHGYDYGNEDNNPLPNGDSHGTHVSGTIAAGLNNSYGIVGVAPRAKIMALQATQPDGYFYDTEIMKSINFAKENGASVINASFGGGSFACFFIYDEATYEAIESFPGLFIAAAGNDSAEHDGSDYVVVPSDYGHKSDCWEGLNNVISVAATNSSDELASFSDYGANFIDVAAPGVDTYSSVSENYSFNETFSSIATGSLPSSWLTTNGNWAVGSVVTFNSASSWGQLLYPDINGAAIANYFYADNDNSYITSPIYDLSAASTEATFNFRARCDTEYVETPHDYMSLEFSADGLAFTPVNLSYSGNEKFDEYILDDLELDSDEDNDSYYYFDDISMDGYFTSNFQFRFHWVSDSDNNNYRGCVVDNISVNYIGDGSADDYDYYSGTSMAAPHVSGLAALIMGYKPLLSDAQVKSIILGAGDSLSSLAGKTVSGKRINAYNALANSDPPNIPVISTIDLHTNEETQIISGTKDANTSLLLNGEEIVSINDSTNWLYEISLVEGDNNISLTSQNSSGLESEAVAAVINYDATRPQIISTVLTGYYPASQIVSLSCKDEDCSLYYTRNNTTPTSDSKTYSQPLTIKKTKILKIIAFDLAGNKSKILRLRITVDRKKPKLSANLKSKTYDQPQTLELTCNEKKCNIYYTKNSTKPTRHAKKYSRPLAVTVTTHLHARAYDQAGNFSKIKKLFIKIE